MLRPICWISIRGITREPLFLDLTKSVLSHAVKKSEPCKDALCNRTFATLLTQEDSAQEAKNSAARFPDLKLKIRTQPARWIVTASSLISRTVLTLTVKTHLNWCYVIGRLLGYIYDATL